VVELAERAADGEAVFTDHSLYNKAASCLSASPPPDMGKAEYLSFVLDEPLERLEALLEPAGRIALDMLGTFEPPRTRTVTALARAAYHDRLPGGEMDPAILAVLADALEESGAAEGMLVQLRRPGPHWRGDAAVDACLGRL
jgi:hypothetical protein